MRRTLSICHLITLVVLALAAGVRAAAPATQPGKTGKDKSPQARLLQDVGIDQHMGAQVPLDATFNDEHGNPVTLRQLLKEEGGKPVILSLVYLNCPMLCTLVLNDLLGTAKSIPQTAGQDYDIWTISFDPKETATLAAQKKASYLASYNHTKGGDASDGWRFLTGNQENIHKVTEAVGFHYKWDAQTHQYIHPAGIMILTPQGKIARYFFGIDYDPTDIRLSLVEASGGKIATPTDRVLLFCYCYNPITGKYGWAVQNVLRACATLTLLALGGLFYWLWRADRRKTRAGLEQVHALAGEGGRHEQ